MEGLEVSILHLSQLRQQDVRFRLDSEFLKKDFLRNESRLKAIPHKLLAETDCTILHPKEITREYVGSEGIWFFRAQNIRPLKVDMSNRVFISKNDARTLAKNSIVKYDVLITRTGANFGQTALYNVDEEAIGSSHTFILRNSFFNQSYLAVFFNTKYGKKLIDRGMYGGSQPEIAPYYLLNIPIPCFSKEFQDKIESCLLTSEEHTSNARQAYTQAEQLLTQELGLQDFRPSRESINIKSLKESFGTSGRLDAEYYQKKYDDYFSLISGYKRGFHRVSEEFDQITEVIHREKEKYHYTEIGDINVGDGSLSFNRVLTENLPANAKIKLADNYILVSKVRPYRGAVGIVYNAPKDHVGSGAFTVLKEKGGYKKETLQVLLRLKAYKELMMKNNVGTSYPVIKDKDVLNLPLPLIDREKQNQIAALIEESFSRKKQSERLLAVARQAVEKAIEESEAAALAWVATQTNPC